MLLNILAVMILVGALTWALLDASIRVLLVIVAYFVALVAGVIAFFWALLRVLMWVGVN